MSQTSARDRERAVQAITRRNSLRQRMERAQQFMKALQGEVPQALRDSLAADQAALSEAVQTVEEYKAQRHQEEERIRRKTEEALRLRAEWRRGQFPNHFSGGSSQWGSGQTFAFVVIIAAMAIMIAVVLLNR